MLNAVIYARYSTDKQNPHSIEDQIAYCRDFAHQYDKDITILKAFSDAATTGKKTSRKGLDELVEFVVNNHIDLVIVESLDRLSRNAAHTHTLFDIFKHYKTDIISPSEGKINKLFVGLKGTMNSMFVDETASKVIRSHRELAKKGIVPGGIAYGYKVKTDAVDERGKRLNGMREIIPEQAKVVRRIFEMYADGAGSKAIAQRLNAENIPSPSGGYWVPSTILGTKSRASGILCNEIYRGRLVWNRVKKKVNPFTLTYQHMVNPEQEQTLTKVEHLRIVDENLWNRVQARYLEKPVSQKEIKRSRSRNNLSGLIYCGVCGSRCQRANETRYVCGSYRTHRVCKNARGLKEDRLINQIFNDLKNWITKNNDLETSFSQIFEDEKQSTKTQSLELEEVNNQIQAFEKVIRVGIDLEEIANALKQLQQKRYQLLSDLHICIPEIPSNKRIQNILIEQGLQGLEDGFQNEEFAQSWRAAMSLLVEKVVTTPIPDKKRGMTIEVKIAPMEGWAEFYRRITAKRAHG